MRARHPGGQQPLVRAIFPGHAAGNNEPAVLTGAHRAAVSPKHLTGCAEVLQGFSQLRIRNLRRFAGKPARPPSWSGAQLSCATPHHPCGRHMQLGWTACRHQTVDIIACWSLQLPTALAAALSAAHLESGMACALVCSTMGLSMLQCWASQALAELHIDQLASGNNASGWPATESGCGGWCHVRPLMSEARRALACSSSDIPAPLALAAALRLREPLALAARTQPAVGSRVRAG